LNLPFVANRSFSVYVSLEGFRSGVASVRTFEVPAETPTQLGDVTLRSNQPTFGALAGQVVDALTGNPLAGVQLTLTRIDQQTPVRAGASLADGSFAIEGLLAARYVLAAAAEGYESTERTIEIFGDSTNIAQLGLSPVLQGGGSVRIVLTWAEDPRDLDSHLWKFRPDGSQEYHIYFGDKQGTGGDFLDLDDTSSFGPETTTIQTLDSNSRYLFAVYDFAGSGSIAATSQARVTVQLGNGTSRVFDAPSGGSERWWSVFEIRNGVIQPCNSACLADSAPALTFSPGSTEALWPKKTSPSTEN
jgi:hypothetical protein